MLEFINSFIGLSITLIIFMIGNDIARSTEYQRFVTLTLKLMGEINYNCDRTARKFWSSLNQLEDRLSNTKTVNTRYF
jgi:hypothetical protein